MSEGRIQVTTLVLPEDVTPNVRRAFLMLSKQIEDLGREQQRLMQGVYAKNSTIPYFLPSGGHVGDVLVFATRVDAQGNVFDSAKWLPAGAAGQTLKSNGPGVDPSWV